MNFLAPLFALGALAVVGPILFHLIRRTTRDVTPFSTLMFLQPTPPRVTRRSRLENLWLLLLRCLAVALLALGFARPFVQRELPGEAKAAGAGKRIVILVDTSASMRREKLWDEARTKADDVLRKSTPADEVAVLAFDRTVRTVVSFDEWKTLPLTDRAPSTTQRLAALKPGWAATHLDAALIHAAELLEQPSKAELKPAEIVIISDLQEGATLDALQGFGWPKAVTVRLDAVRARHAENASVSWVAEWDEADTSTEDAPLRLRVTNAAESKREQFPVRWSQTTDASAEVTAYVPSGQSRIVRAPKPPERATSLTLTGDDTAFDNTAFVLPAQPTKVPLLFVGQDADDDPRASLYYLRRAFPKTRSQSVEITAHRDAAAVPAFQLQQAQLLVLGENASDAALASARQFARDGRIVIAPLTSAASAQAVARFLENPQFSASEAPVKDYALLAQIDFQHPLFAPFADPRFSDFTKIHFWKYRRFDAATLPGAHVLARFDSGDPAIVQVPLGKGSVVIFASSWRPLDSQLALSSKFVPLLQALLEQSSNAPAQKAQYVVGDEVPLPAEPAALQVRKPDGSEVAATAGTKFAGTDQPGIYAVTPGALRFIVNLAPEESRTSPLPLARFTALGVPLPSAVIEAHPPTQQQLAQRQAAELEGQQKLWRWLIVAALGVLLLETLIAGKLSRTVRSSTTATA